MLYLRSPERVCFTKLRLCALQPTLLIPSQTLATTIKLLMFLFSTYSVCVFFFKKGISSLFVWWFVCMPVYCVSAWCLQKPEEAIRTIVSHGVSLGIEPLSSGRAENALDYSVISPALHVFVSVIGRFTQNKPSQFIPAVATDRILYEGYILLWCIYCILFIHLSEDAVCYIS